MAISLVQLLLETCFLLCICHVMSSNFPGLDKIFQHEAIQPPFTPKIPHYAFFQENLQKPINFIVEYKTTCQQLSCNMLFDLNYMCSCCYKGSKFGCALVIFQSQFKKWQSEGRCFILHGLWHYIWVNSILTYPSAQTSFKIYIFLRNL